MGAMTSKAPSYATHSSEVDASRVPDILAFLGTPVGDALNAQILSNGRAKVIRTLSNVIEGDLAYSGNMVGIVTDIVEDSDPAMVGIEVTFHTPYMQEANASSVSDKVVVFNIVDNEEGSNLGGEKTYFKDSMTGRQVAFLKVDKGISPDFSTLAAATGTAGDDGIDTDTITLTLKDDLGETIPYGGHEVVFSVDSETAVLGTVTDVGDGTYTVTVANTVAETVVVSASVNGIAITATDEVEFS